MQNGTSFLSGGGHLGELIGAHDWSSTALGSIEDWPSHIKVATSLMLRSNVPIVMLWGESGVMIYNDAYSVFAGKRHPQLLGSNVREGWPEVAEFNDNVMKVGLAGGTLGYQDQELTLQRHGRAEPAWMNLDYSPLLDERGIPAGVVAMVVETTGKVLAERRLSTESERLSSLFAQAPSFMVMLVGPTHRIELANRSYMRLIGERDVIGRTIEEALPEAAAQGYLTLLDRVFQTGEAFSAKGLKFEIQPIAGGKKVDRYLDFVYQPIRGTDGSVTGIFVDGVDVTDRVLADRLREKMVSLTDEFRDLQNPDDVTYTASKIIGDTLGVSRVGYGTVDHDSEVLHVVRDWSVKGVASLQGTTRLRDYGSFVDNLKRDELLVISDVMTDPRTAPMTQALARIDVRSLLNVPVVEHGRLVAMFYLNDSKEREWSDAEIAFVREVAARTRTAAERVRNVEALRNSETRLREANETLEAKVEARTRELMEVEAQFRQAQKMEAIGQLTGGIAHDFNNLLHGMGTSLEVLGRRLSMGKTDNAERYIGMSQEAIKRAAALTQRLLAFSRRQTLDPKATDVNRLIGGMEELIRRSVGPSIVVEVVGAAGLWPTKIDASQLENALLNLCINSRDAMTEMASQSGQPGRLTIETANKWMDDRTAADRGMPPGQYISLCVTDTGSGMAPDVIARAFDPFFTTKPVGAGTGLGLSMVYGFVRQSGGQVRIYSELGQGTTMCLYLPRYMGEIEPEIETKNTDDGSSDGEVVFLVEDDSTIRALVSEELEDLGYQVITSSNGPDAVAMLSTRRRIDLLITDVGLPGGLNGRQIADAGRATRPDLKVLFITGYAENAAVGNGLLAPGMEVLTKPFVLSALAQKVSLILGERGRSDLTD